MTFWKDLDKNWQKWDHRFLELALLVSSWSKDPSTKCGAVITRDRNRIVSVGYNGLPMGIKDSDPRLNDRNMKYAMIIHAEQNAIFFSNSDLKECTMYTVPFQSCAYCASTLIQRGIDRLVSIDPSLEIEERWSGSIELAKDILEEGRVDLVLYPRSILPQLK